MAHHPIFQKEIDELLAKVAIESLTGSSAFSSNVFVVSKCTSYITFGYDTYSILSDVIIIFTNLHLRYLLPTGMASYSTR